MSARFGIVAGVTGTGAVVAVGIADLWKDLVEEPRLRHKYDSQYRLLEEALPQGLNF